MAAAAPPAPAKRADGSQYARKREQVLAGLWRGLDRSPIGRVDRPALALVEAMVVAPHHGQEQRAVPQGRGRPQARCCDAELGSCLAPTSSCSGRIAVHAAHARADARKGIHWTLVRHGLVRAEELRAAAVEALAGSDGVVFVTFEPAIFHVAAKGLAAATWTRARAGDAGWRESGVIPPLHPGTDAAAAETATVMVHLRSTALRYEGLVTEELVGLGSYWVALERELNARMRTNHQRIMKLLFSLMSPGPDAPVLQWTPRDPDATHLAAGSPSLHRFGHTLTQIDQDTLLVLGGESAAAAFAPFLRQGPVAAPLLLSASTTLRKEGAGLSRAADAPQALAERVHHAACKVEADILVFGGRGSPQRAMGDLWVFSSEAQRWELHHPAVAPELEPLLARWGHSMHAMPMPPLASSSAGVVAVVVVVLGGRNARLESLPDLFLIGERLAPGNVAALHWRWVGTGSSLGLVFHAAASLPLWDPDAPAALFADSASGEPAFLGARAPCSVASESMNQVVLSRGARDTTPSAAVEPCSLSGAAAATAATTAALASPAAEVPSPLRSSLPTPLGRVCVSGGLDVAALAAGLECAASVVEEFRIALVAFDEAAQQPRLDWAATKAEGAALRRFGHQMVRAPWLASPRTAHPFIASDMPVALHEPLLVLGGVGFAEAATATSPALVAVRGERVPMSTFGAGACYSVDAMSVHTIKEGPRPLGSLFGATAFVVTGSCEVVVVGGGHQNLAFGAAFPEGSGIVRGRVDAPLHPVVAASAAGSAKKAGAHAAAAAAAAAGAGGGGAAPSSASTVPTPAMPTPAPVAANRRGAAMKQSSGALVLYMLAPAAKAKALKMVLEAERVFDKMRKIIDVPVGAALVSAVADGQEAPQSVEQALASFPAPLKALPLTDERVDAFLRGGGAGRAAAQAALGSLPLVVVRVDASAAPSMAVAAAAPTASVAQRGPYERLRQSLAAAAAAAGILGPDAVDALMPVRPELVGDVLLVGEEFLVRDAALAAASALEAASEGSTTVWSLLAAAFGARRVGRRATVAPDARRSSRVQLLWPEDVARRATPPKSRFVEEGGPSFEEYEQSWHRTREWQAPAGWTEVRESGVLFGLDITRLMFCSGNNTERMRMASYPPTGPVAETVVDLYAGIGYYTLPTLLRARAHHGRAVVAAVEAVHCFEWNPESVFALLRNLHANHVTPRCLVYPGDNRLVTRQLLDLSNESVLVLRHNAAPEHVAPAAAGQSQLAGRGCADRVLLGLLPSSEEMWAAAVRFLRQPEQRDPRQGGILHVHGNALEVGGADTAWVAHVMRRVATEWRIARLEARRLHGRGRARIVVHVQRFYAGGGGGGGGGDVVEVGDDGGDDGDDGDDDDGRAAAAASDEPEERWLVQCLHVEKVKSYAPRVAHLVCDVRVSAFS
jgi:tRNA G37 N-methylase Trm5/tRNA(Phe) wybutosine-synthesizing methylase Tyw3